MTDEELEKKFAGLELPTEERWENLTLANDYIFGWVMHDADLCAEMLKRILPELDIGRIVFIDTQKSFRQTIDTYGIRLDVYVKSHSGKIYNIEIQTTDKKDLPRRTRAYHIMMAADVMEKNKEILSKGVYENMPDSYVIFICTFDPFKEGRHIYTFRNTCKECSGLELNDGAYTIFLNTKGRKNDIGFGLEAFLEFLNGRVTAPDDPFIKALQDKVAVAKQNHNRRREYMWEMMRRRELIGEGRAEGMAQGRAEGRVEGLTQASEVLSKSVGKHGITQEAVDFFRASFPELLKGN